MQVNVDTTEALEGIKEVTEAANECVAALEKLETVINRFKGDNESKEQVIKVNTRFLDEKAMAKVIAEFKKNTKFSL
nr:hypothetical protein [Bacillus wiedmannii]